MPPGDLYIAVAAHLGEGRFMLNVLAPEVIDEDDPVATDPAWDMYDPANERSRQDGFRSLDWGVSGMVTRKARLGRHMTIYRTLANPGLP